MNRTVLSGARILLAFVRRAEMSRDDRVSYDVIYNNKDRLPKPFTTMTYGEIIDTRSKWANERSVAIKPVWQE